MSLNSECRLFNAHIARTDRASSRTLLRVPIPELTDDELRTVEEETDRFIARLRSAIGATGPRVNSVFVSAVELCSSSTISLAVEQMAPRT